MHGKIYEANKQVRSPIDENEHNMYDAKLRRARGMPPRAKTSIVDKMTIPAKEITTHKNEQAAEPANKTNTLATIEMKSNHMPEELNPKVEIRKAVRKQVCKLKQNRKVKREDMYNYSIQRFLAEPTTPEQHIQATKLIKEKLMSCKDRWSESMRRKRKLIKLVKEYNDFAITLLDLMKHMHRSEDECPNTKIR